AACVRRLSFGVCFFFFSSRRRHTRFSRDWSSDVCSSDLATSGLGVEKSEVEHCIYSVLIGEREMKEVIRSTAIDGLEVVPATIALAGAEIELVPQMSREFRLKRSLEPVVDEYDFIVIDSPPSLGLLTVNGLTAAHGVLVPIQSEYYALEGLSQLMSTIEMVRTHLNPRLEVDGVVITMYDARTNLSQAVLEDVKSFFEGRIRVFETVIPRNIRLSEAPSFGLPIVLYDDRSKGAQAYRALAEEVLAG